MRVLTMLLIISITSCSFFEEEKLDGAVARVKNKQLMLSDIVSIVPEGSAKEDSILIINSYIQSWIKENLILQKAELNLKGNETDFEKQLEDYRKSLIIFTYEKELISQRLDTIVTKEEIEAFYDINKQNFELTDDIVKVRYLKVLKNAPQVNKIRKLYKSTKPEDIEKLKELSHQYAEKFHFNDGQWILFEELKKEIPLNITATDVFLKNVKNVEAEDSLSYYFAYITMYKLKNGVAPLSFEAANIKSIIINKRKTKLMSKIRTDLYEEAFLNKEIEIYDNVKNEK